MPDYVSSSACRGRRPKRLEATQAHSRPILVSKLMRERAVARFLVAPDGFGKSEIALEYADMIFSFKNTFWFDAASPCFLRDLDRGTFADAITGKDPVVKLVVFDGVPRLDASRADEMSRTIDSLLARGSEVVVTLAPSCDAYGSRQSDRIRIGAADMLLSDAEIDAARTGEERALAPAPTLGPAERVPAMVWGGAAGCERFVEGIVAEDLPAEELAVIFEMLALGFGPIGEIGPVGFTANEGGSDAGSFAANYPYLGINEDAERFDAPDVPVDLLVREFSPAMRPMAAALGKDGADELCGELAHRLVARGRAERACDLVRTACTRAAREAWLSAHDKELLAQACLAKACELYASTRSTAAAQDGLLRVAEIVRLAVLEDAAARELAVRAALSPVGGNEARALGAALSLSLGAGANRRPVREALSRALGVEPGAGSAGVVRALAARPDRARRLWWAAGAVALAADDDPQGALGPSCWAALAEAGAPEPVLAVAGAMLLKRWASAASGAACGEAGSVASTGAGKEAGSSFAFARLGSELAEVAERTAAAVERSVGRRGFADLLSYLCAKALGNARSAGLSVRELDADARSAVRRTGERIAAQRVSLPVRRRALPPRGGRLAGEPHAPRSPRPRVKRQPTLRVDLFGGFSVSIDGVPVDARLLKRKKLKALIALLALDAGRDIPRDRLVEALWPDSDPDAGRKCLYTLWALAKRVLSLPDGTCPYLVRMQSGYKLDDRWFESDVRRVDALVRSLLFGRADSRAWADALADLDAIRSVELMPCESESRAIERRRLDYRRRITDAFVAAARRLSDDGDVRTALWFARAAYERDSSREDVYVALMRAQIGCGQRTSALETFFECRTFLADGLGIDPSAELVSMYRSIIEEEAIIDW